MATKREGNGGRRGKVTEKLSEHREGGSGAARQGPARRVVVQHFIGGRPTNLRSRRIQYILSA
jgi:hypothetical protein